MKSFKNKKAYHNYYFIQEIEAGIVLKGTEIKSIRAGKVNFKDSYAKIENKEVWLHNLHISIYDQASYFNHEPERPRKLLLNKQEIRKLIKKTEERGMTLIPTKLYINDKGFAKLSLGLAQGKRLHDKRDTLQKKDEMRNMQRQVKYRDY